MSSMKAKFAVLILIAGLLTACGSQPTETPASASQPTEQVVSVTDTSVPATAAPESSPTSEPAAVTGVSFTNDIMPIIQSRCINCHGGDRTEEGLSMKSHAELMTGSENGPVVFPGDSVNSLMAELTANNKMPKRGPKLTPPQVQLIVDWINQGALNN